MMQVISPAPREAWRSVIADDSEALPEHAPEWVDALCRVGPYVDASRLYAFSDGRRFVLPLVRRTGVTGVGGSLMSYPPSWGMGGRDRTRGGSGHHPSRAGRPSSNREPADQHSPGSSTLLRVVQRSGLRDLGQEASTRDRLDRRSGRRDAADAQFGPARGQSRRAVWRADRGRSQRRVAGSVLRAVLASRWTDGLTVSTSRERWPVGGLAGGTR